MREKTTLGCLLAGSFLLTACPGPPPPPPPPVELCDGITEVKGTAIELQEIASGFSFPVYLTSPPEDINRLFVVERAGTIKIIQNGQVLATPFLDIEAQVLTNEQSDFTELGLLSIAFHPDFEKNGKFYASYTAPPENAGDAATSIISEFTVSQDPNVADLASEKVILKQGQPFANHNGGLIKFGPDGFLYIGFGDGGSQGDPNGNGQNLGTRLGKLLRIDVDNGDPFAVPPDNPFVNQQGVLPEIWDFGLRNPWRFSFDRETEDLYIGDVGQNQFEEVDFEPAGQGGKNWGWNPMEGNGHCFGDPDCNNLGIELPITEFNHADGACSMVGGYVYRGCAMPDLHGTYFFGDTCAGFVNQLQVAGGVAQNEQEVFPTNTATFLTSFGEDARGELYLVLLGDSDNGGGVLQDSGRIFKVVPAGQ